MASAGCAPGGRACGQQELAAPSLWGLSSLNKETDHRAGLPFPFAHGLLGGQAPGPEVSADLPVCTM